MSIANAIYRDNDNEELINLEDISIRDDYELIKENLFCSFGGCNCPLQFVPRGKYSEYLKKRINEIHIESCRHFAPNNLNGRSRRIAGTSNSLLRDDHVANILRGIIDDYNETEEERQQRLARQREAARQRRNNRVNNNSIDNDIEEVYVNNPTTSSSGEVSTDDERNPSVRRRHSILDITTEDIGETEAIAGDIVEITNNENQTILRINDKSRHRDFYIYLEEVFFGNSPVNIPRSLSILKDILDTAENIQISCVGEIVFRNDSLGMLLLGVNFLRINRVPLSVFIARIT